MFRMADVQMRMHERRGLWMGFNKWAQTTGMALMNDTLYGKLNGTN